MSKTERRNLLSRAELARSCNVNTRTIAKWETAGMPVARRGRPGHASGYDLADVEAWRAAQQATRATDQEDFTRARSRKELAQAIEAEQRVAIRAGQLLAVADVERTWGAIVTAVRSRLLAMPQALADKLHRLAVTDGAGAVESALHDAIYGVLRELGEDQAQRPARRDTRRSKARKAKSRKGRA